MNRIMIHRWLFFSMLLYGLTILYVPPTIFAQQKSLPGAKGSSWALTSPLVLTNTESSISIDLRDHGLDPRIAVALVGQTVVWTNNGARVQTITEGMPNRLFLPLITNNLSAAGSSTPRPAGAPRLGSGTIAPGNQYAYTFSVVGTYNYYSANNPIEIIGTVVVVEAGQITSTVVGAGTSLSLAAPSGAKLEVPPTGVVVDTQATISQLVNRPPPSKL